MKHEELRRCKVDVEIGTTSDEDRKGKEILEEALDQAFQWGRYRAGDLGAELDPFSTEEYPDVNQLWEKLCAFLGINA